MPTHPLEQFMIPPQFDFAFSPNVLKYLQKLDDNFAMLRRLLRPGGFFTSPWGPMWHSYNGDHIGAELGFDSRFEYVRLPMDEYLAHYKVHPRNRTEVGPTDLVIEGVSLVASVA